MSDKMFIRSLIFLTMRIEQNFIADIKNIVQDARKQTYAAINYYMLEAYWKVGQRIVMEEQKGELKAEYGTFLIKELSKTLTSELGRGFSEVNLKSFRLFYLVFSGLEKGRQRLPFLQKDENQEDEKMHAVSTFSELIDSSQLRKELTWSHYQLIMRVDNPKAMQFYINEAANHNWSVRSLRRNINTMYYERILSSNYKSEALIKADLLEAQSPADFVKDPYIFEFVNIPKSNLTELILEAAIINNLKDFLLELGKGFCFVQRQFYMNTENKSFYIDLVLYNHILKCFVLIDLKTGELTREDVSQIDMYVRMFDDLKRSKTDNPTIGIILCTSKDATIVKYSVLKDNEQLFASKYRSYLPSEEELISEIERNKQIFEEQIKNSELQ
jgi:predicted nuclease of restriction endonuclease-like (RecB) superfamily